MVGDGALGGGGEVAGAALEDLELEVDGVDVVLDGPPALGAVAALAAREVADVAVDVARVRLEDRLVQRREAAPLLVAGERTHVAVHLVHVVVDAGELVRLKVAVVVRALVIWKAIAYSYISKIISDSFQSMVQTHLSTLSGSF